ncbi:HEAT repeat domain-containing protein [Gemmata sp. JC717]|uniref:PVC-type heme-binding CxxCH protein n=1 Tax=Gemmata algarum TaxID=2975278 RepID=UPI0021BB56F6|nr:PVC-type heme-binding CxxCH protein [Gemmata algarum]MDY3551782.1 HEAT repeat domain-containing protein [Gemmata algarum]
MPRFSLALPLALLVSLGGLAPPGRLLAQKEFGFDNRKGSGQPYLKPDETVAKFKVADEFEVKLFAGEPQVVNPVAFTIDEKGRVWVVECFEYPKRTPKGKAPRDRIVILEDTDGDGVCDKRTVFAEGKDFPVPEERAKAGLGAFDLCTGIEVGHGGVFVGAAPYLYFIENKNDKPGKFEVLLKGFGSQDTHETLNTFQWGPDGWLYGLHGVFTQSNVQSADGPETRMNAAVWRYHPKQKKFEVFAEGTSNPWGMDWRNSDGQFILACCVIPHLYHIVPGGVYKRQAGASYNPHAYGFINEICDHTFHKESGWAHAGLISLDAPHMPKRFQNSVIFGSIHGCSIKQNILKPNGSSYTATRGDDFLQSGDKNVRPINLKWGPAGDIYLIDWHDQNPCHQTAPDNWDYERGRVYRIQLKGTKTKKAENLGKKTAEELIALGNAPDPYRYRTALRLLAERATANDGKPRVSGDTTKPIQNDPENIRSFWPRIAAVHDLQVSANDADIFFTKNNPVVRAWVARLLGERAAKDDGELIAAAAKRAKVEPDSFVRREFASAALRLSGKHDVTPLLRALMAHKEDAKDPIIPHLVWLAYEKVLTQERKAPAEIPRGADAPRSPTESELAWLAEQAPDNIFVRDQIVPKVMRRLVATGKPDDLKLCVEFVAKVKDAATREKALDGLAVALDKQTVTAPDAWAALQAEIAKENNPKLVALANKLAVSFRDPVAVKRALDSAANPKLAVEARGEAVRQLALLKPAEALPLLVALTSKAPDAPDALRAEAVRALAAFDGPTVPNALLGNWKDVPKSVRPDAVSTLSTRKEWARALLTALADKKLDRAEVTDNTVLRIQAFNDKELNALIEKAWGRTRATPAELAKLIDKTRDSLYEAPASFERGQKVFEANCGKCHKFDGKGAEVGPPLDGAGRDIEYLLANVLDPNRVIGAPYFLRTARLLDDTVFSGLLAEEDDKTITLKLENAVVKKIKKEDLAEPVRVAEKSLMPEGLGYNMTPQDFRDLVRYVMANPFVTTATVNGTKLKVGVPGRLVLPDTKGAPAVLEAEFTAPVELKTKLLIGSTGDYELRLDGKAIGTGQGAGKDVRPDRDGVEVTLPAGTHTLTVVVKGAGANVVYARFLDPDRKLRYPEPAEKK